ncbi:C-type lectin 1-like [Mytilus edulis]|uniref:C-type lectin 1-like n=1 Tax=Mytilus edulis TaxID=6550 RepID=UPI0039F0AA2D
MVGYEVIIVLATKLSFISAILYCAGIGWDLLGSKCYKVIRLQSSGVSYHEGRSLCAIENSKATPIMPKTEQENALAVQFENTVGYFWLGLTDFDEDNIWNWEDGTLASFTDWINGNPDILTEHCVALAFTGWHDNPCSVLRGVVCQQEPLSDKYFTLEQAVDGNTVIQTTTVYSVLCCGIRCFSHSLCTGFRFNSSDHTCDMLTVSNSAIIYEDIYI